MVMVKDGTDGKDGKGYEWIYTRTNIIGLTPDKPDSKQQDDYIPEGWTDDFLGVDADHQVEWACKRVKRDGVWRNGALRPLCTVGVRTGSRISWPTLTMRW